MIEGEQRGLSLTTQPMKPVLRVFQPWAQQYQHGL